jgi:DNA-binding transcriptional MerR regulator
MTVDIGDVIEGSGLAASTLHLWERHSLIESTGRAGLRRQYDDDIFERISLVIAYQLGGFTLSEIAELLRRSGGTKLDLAIKRDELIARRAALDVAIEGLDHALSCPEPEPLSCQRFLSKIRHLLPVTPRPLGRPARSEC